MDKKITVRTNSKNLRKTLNITEFSQRAVKLIRDNESYKNSKHVMLFYPTRYELDLTPLFEDEKIFYLPRVRGKELEICRFEGIENLKKSDLNILEPTGKPIELQTIDLVIVPALSVDEEGYRIGYGGGFYDRFLKNYNGKTLCPIPKPLYVKSLPHEDFDIPINEVIVC